MQSLILQSTFNTQKQRGGTYYISKARGSRFDRRINLRVTEDMGAGSDFYITKAFSLSRSLYNL